MLISLPNGCSCSELKVSPKNWNKPASIGKPWFIHYRFYDPEQPAPMAVKIRGMNRYKEYPQRYAVTRELLKNEQEMLEKGYNPFKKDSSNSFLIEQPEPESIYPIKPDMELTVALDQVLNFLQVEPEMKSSIKSSWKMVKQSAQMVHLDKKEISTITRRDIKLLLEKCMQVNKHWGNNRFNVCRAHMSMAWTQFKEFEAAEYNPVLEIKKRKHEPAVRQFATREERVLISKQIKKRNYNFWNYLNIFFHSGSRSKELFRVQGKHVDLEKGCFKVLVKKGQQMKEMWRPIKDIAIPFWRVAMSNCGPDDFLFGKSFKPRQVPMKANQVSRLWKRYVKDPKSKGGLGMPYDFYTLKAINLDEIAAETTLEHAQAMAGHTTPVITLKHYALGETERQAQRLKKINNSFD